MCNHIKIISLTHYRVPQKTFKFLPVVPKVHNMANVCVHWKSIKPCNSKKCFYMGRFAVVHPYLNFSLRRQSIKFQTANFSIFCACIIVIFWTTCIAREVFSLVVMGNGKQVLLVLQCLKRGIAFVSLSTCTVNLAGHLTKLFSWLKCWQLIY